MPNNNQERLEREALESLVANDLSAKMKQWRSQNQPPPQSNGKWLILLLFLLLVSGGVTWLYWPEAKHPPAPEPVQAPPPVTEQKTLPVTPPAMPARNYAALARQTYRLPEFTNQIRGNLPDAPSQVLQQAQKALTDRQYPEVLKILDQAPAEYQSDARYLRGHACFGLKQYHQAAMHFEGLQNSVRYNEDAEWYLLLAQLAADTSSVKKVQKNLKNIARDTGHSYQMEASKLLQILQ